VIISRNAQAAAPQLAEETGAYLVVLMDFISYLMAPASLVILAA